MSAQIPRGFSPLSEVAAITSKWAPRSVIGIVTSITSVSPTTKGDLTRSLRIVDPSNCIESDFSDSQSFRVNCFMKKYEQWLPAAKVGDVVILRTIKTTGNGSANGYSDSFKWAVYDSAKGQVGHGDLAGAPESEGLANGFGAMFTPFYQATDADSAYCLALDDWWRSVKEKREGEMGTVHQIGSGSSSRPKKRQHMLASDFSESETAEYFDCTVEVLAGYQNDYSTFSLYVTDYTTLQGGRTQQQNWCPPSLADSVLKIEMWDAARELGPQMFAGDFYWLKNVRMVTDRDGYREAKLVESKTLKLEPADADTYPHFKALIQRKKAFGSVDKIEDSPMKLIVQAKHREYFTCVVELLHVEDGKPVIYVTDYTSHSNMSAINKSWTAGLETRVLKVLLSDNQANFIQHLTVGDIYRISHLRLQVSGAGVQGTLGGSERLIHPINPRSSSLEEWKTNLVERKNDLKRKTGRLPSNVPPEVEVSPPENRHDYVSIKQLLLSTKCPGTFFVRARITDFFPFRLNDSFVRTCTHCKQVLSMERLSCFHCNDVEHNYVEIVSFLRVLINDGDDELKLSICGNVPLLDGLEPVILRDDPEAARRFSERIKPLLNNLVEVHDGILEKRMVKPAGPVMTLIVDSWKGEEGEIVYGLTDYER
ncbi:hypothetical protein C8R44DRAFT_766044 [Mycena epipterygia]|nr:hypothetical protein C8R44DRAFT_766044 [Mycena epipterygia]